MGLNAYMWEQEAQGKSKNPRERGRAKTETQFLFFLSLQGDVILHIIVETAPKSWIYK